EAAPEGFGRRNRSRGRVSPLTDRIVPRQYRTRACQARSYADRLLAAIAGTAGHPPHGRRDADRPRDRADGRGPDETRRQDSGTLGTIRSFARGFKYRPGTVGPAALRPGFLAAKLLKKRAFKFSNTGKHLL